MVFNRFQWFRIFVFVGQNCMTEDQITALVVDFEIW